MAGYTFTRAEEAVVGEYPLSRKYNLRARAGNDRALSGLGDFCWRLVWWAFAVARQIRNPVLVGDVLNFTGQPADEMLRSLVHVDPQVAGGIETPGPGEEGGWNLQNPLAALAYGAQAANLDPEDLRWDVIPLRINGGLPTRPAEYWELAKGQRGAIDLTAGQEAAPAVQSAREHDKLAYAYASPYLKTYGGFFPTRENIGDCGDRSDDPPKFATPLYDIFFTNLQTGEVRHYTGFCPPNAPNGVGTIAGIGYGRNYYRIFGEWQFDARTGSYYGVLSELLSTHEWIEGPYQGGGRPQKGESHHIEQIFQWFLKDFRGATAQRVDKNYDVEEVGYNFQRAPEEQYRLAPARGAWNAETNELEVSYPTWEVDGVDGVDGVDSGTEMPVTVGPAEPGRPTEYRIHEGFCVGGFAAVATGLAAAVGLQFWVDGVVVHTMSLTPADGTGAVPAGYADGLKYFGKPVARGGADDPPPHVGGYVKVVLVGNLRFRPDVADSGLTVQLAELQSYKPIQPDLFCVCRVGSTGGGDGTGVSTQLDTIGENFFTARQLSEDLLDNGCIINRLSDGLPGQIDPASPLNLNSGFEAARRMLNDTVRLAGKAQLRAYAVENGKSVLYYRRYAEGWEDAQADIFKGIAPSPEPIAPGAVQPLQLYQVRSGVEILYNGVVYVPGDTFVGVNHVEEYTLTANSSGNEKVWEVEGLRQVAPPRGLSNRWALFFNLSMSSPLLAGQPNLNSLFSEGNYDSFVTLTNRCQLFSFDLVNGRYPDLSLHISNNAPAVYFPESPSGWTYAKGSHQPQRWIGEGGDELRLRHFRSCQIYQAPYEIESVTVQGPVTTDAGVYLSYGGGEPIVTDQGSGDIIAVSPFVTGADEELVRVELKERLRHNPTDWYPTNRDTNTWDRARVRTDPQLGYRTDENAILQYLLLYRSGENCPQGVIGDFDPNSGLDSIHGDEGVTDDPWGGCFPRTFMFKLLSEVPDDQPVDNDEPDVAEDRILYVDEEIRIEQWLRVMCEGFIDEASTVALGCRSNESLMYDYKQENFFFDATGKKWLSLLARYYREDGERGYGPLPRQIVWESGNTSIGAEWFNDTVKCFNKLDKVRVELPFDLECRLRITAGATFVAAQWPDGGECVNSGTSKGAVFGVTAPTEGVSTTYGGACNQGDPDFPENCWSRCGDDVQGIVLDARRAGSLTTDCSGTGEFALVGSHTMTEYRLKIHDPLVLNVLPDKLKDHLTDGTIGFLGRFSSGTVRTRLEKVFNASESLPGTSCEGFFYDPTDGFGYTPVNEPEVLVVQECRLFNTGIIEAPGLPSADLLGGRFAETDCSTGSANSTAHVEVTNTNPQAYVQVPMV